MGLTAGRGINDGAGVDRTAVRGRTSIMSSANSDRIAAIVKRETARLRAVTVEEASRKPGPDRWCPKEVLGHLVDSALNNHQRFVRAQLADTLDFPGYAQDDWVRCQGYADADWTGLIKLWVAVNRHLAHVVSRIPAAALSTPVRIGTGAPNPLSRVIDDYLRHLEHHLEQI